MGVEDVAVGLAMLAATLGTAAYAARRVTRSWLAWGVVASALVVAEHAVPLALGILNRGTVLAATAVVLLAALRGRGSRVPWRRSRPHAFRDRVRPRVAWLVPVIPAAGAVAFLAHHAGEPPTSVDTLAFQLPQVARWIHTGSLWQLDQFFPDYSNATYPSHGNVLLLAVTLPFDSTFLARLVAVPFAVGACGAVYAGARHLGATPARALIAASVLAAAPVLARTSLVGANTDPEFLFFLLAAVVLLLRDRPEERWVAAVAVGLALGTKWYALTVLPPLALVWLVARRPRPRLVARLGVVALGVGGIWLVRNWVLTGNPLFPQPLPGLNAPRDVYRETSGSSLLDYATDPTIWRVILWPQFRLLFAAPGVLLALVPLFVLARTGFRRYRSGHAAEIEYRKPVPGGHASPGPVPKRHGTVVAVMALLALAGYAATPYSALGPPGNPVGAAASMRYALPGLALGAIVLARAPRLVLAVAVVAVLQGTAAIYEPPVRLDEVVLAGLVLLGTLALFARAPRATAVVLAAAAVFGVSAIRDPGGYGAEEPAIAWVERYAPAGVRIALAGDWSVPGLQPALPAFGPRLGNEVFYAGPFVDHMLRHERDPRRFARRLAGADVVIVGRGLAPAGRPAPEEAWARAAGFELVAASPRLAALVRQ